MCCGSPEPQCEARCTETDPAHEQAACNLPVRGTCKENNKYRGGAILLIGIAVACCLSPPFTQGTHVTDRHGVNNSEVSLIGQLRRNLWGNHSLIDLTPQRNPRGTLLIRPYIFVTATGK